MINCHLSNNGKYNWEILAFEQVVFKSTVTQLTEIIIYINEQVTLKTN